MTGSIDMLSAMFAGVGPGPARFAALFCWIVAGNLAGGVLFALSIRYSLVAQASRQRA